MFSSASPNSTDIDSNNSFSYCSNISLSTIQAVIKSLNSFINSSFRLSPSLFTNTSLPEISIEDYLTRIIELTQIEESTLILSLIYIDRLCSNTNMEITELDIHKIALTAIILSIKYNEDIIYSQEEYANVGGVDTKELTTLEAEFLNGLEFKLFINTTEFKMYRDLLYKNVPFRKQDESVNNNEIFELENDDFKTKIIIEL
jgi:hypothetical protein